MTTSKHRQHSQSTVATHSPCVGIWRLLDRFHQGHWTDLYYAQPAEASGSPRADYVVKMVTDRVDSHVEGQMQIRAEAASCEAVHHPNLVALLDARLNAPRPYIVLPRLEGSPLSTWMAQRYAQPLPVCLWWIRQAAQAIDALHQANWIHGDLKPDNLMISPRGHLTVIDLGLSCRSGGASDPNRYQGTPEYSAPELIENAGDVTLAVDVYALGVVFYQLLTRTGPTGTRQFIDAATLRETSVPPPLIELAIKMLAEQPADRITVNRLIDELFRLEIETLGMHIHPQDGRPLRVA